VFAAVTANPIYHYTYGVTPFSNLLLQDDNQGSVAETACRQNFFPNALLPHTLSLTLDNVAFVAGEG